jgi:hypothetical protein
MYIYDPKLSGAQSLLKKESINLPAGVRDSYYSDRGICGFGGRGGSSGSYLWAKEGLGEPAPQQSKRSEAEVRALRESLNKWRVLKGETPITEMGPLGPLTKKAIQEFQNDSGLKRFNGVADAATRERLTLLLDILKNIPNERLRLLEFVRSAGFNSLEGPTQGEVLRRIVRYTWPGAPDPILQLNKIWNLMAVVKKAGFEHLRKSSQKLMLRLLGARPDEGSLAALLANLVERGFGNLEEPMQTFVLKQIERYGGNMNRVANLVDLITGIRNSSFDQFSKESRNFMLVALANRPDNKRLVNNFHKALDAPSFWGVAFRDLDQLTQTDVLNRVATYPSNDRKINNLTEIVKSPGFGKLAFDLRSQILDGLPSRFANVDLDPVIIGNLMTLVTALGFSKLRPEVRGLMFDLQAARPDNAQLANALGNLAFGPKLHDRRTANQTIMQVNDSIP